MKHPVSHRLLFYTATLCAVLAVVGGVMSLVRAADVPNLSTAGERGGVSGGNAVTSLWTNTGSLLSNASGHNVDFANQRGINTTDPTLATDGANKQWLDGEIHALDLRLQALEH